MEGLGEAPGAAPAWHGAGPALLRAPCSDHASLPRREGNPPLWSVGGGKRGQVLPGPHRTSCFLLGCEKPGQTQRSCAVPKDAPGPRSLCRGDRPDVGLSVPSTMPGAGQQQTDKTPRLAVLAGRPVAEGADRQTDKTPGLLGAAVFHRSISLWLV